MTEKDPSTDENTGFAVVSLDVLPEVFHKVIEVKRMLAVGDEKSSVSACKKVGISRSAYYKYRDNVFAYEEKLRGQVVSLYIVLRDTPGVLSSVLSLLHDLGTNIMTLNQSAAVDGAAVLTVTVKLSRLMDGDALKKAVAAVEGVVSARLISEE